MIVELTEAEGAAIPFNFSIAPEELDLDIPDFRLAGDVRAEGEVVKSAAQVESRGTISAKAEIDCSRCLEPISKDLVIDFAVGFVPAENFASDKEHEVSAENLDIDQLDDDRLDLKDVVREQILLNLPEQVFCKPDCKGLCPECGANLNLIDCKCGGNEPDPRWAALKNLK
jgi:uncharacterized protein